MTKDEFLKIVSKIDGVEVYESDSLQTWVSIPQELLGNDSYFPAVKLGLRDCSFFSTKSD